MLVAALITFIYAMVAALFVVAVRWVSVDGFEDAEKGFVSTRGAWVRSRPRDGVRSES